MTRTRRAAYWLLLLAFATNALGLRALAAQDGGDAWTQLCTSSGIRQLPGGFPPPGKSAKPAPCPLCTPNGGVVFAPGPVHSPVIAEHLRVAPAIAALQPLRVVQLHASPQPRAPPLIA